MARKKLDVGESTRSALVNGKQRQGRQFPETRGKSWLGVYQDITRACVICFRELCSQLLMKSKEIALVFFKLHP